MIQAILQTFFYIFSSREKTFQSLFLLLLLLLQLLLLLNLLFRYFALDRLEETEEKSLSNESNVDQSRKKNDNDRIEDWGEVKVRNKDDKEREERESKWKEQWSNWQFRDSQTSMTDLESAFQFLREREREREKRCLTSHEFRISYGKRLR